MNPAPPTLDDSTEASPLSPFSLSQPIKMNEEQSESKSWSPLNKNPAEERDHPKLNSISSPPSIPSFDSISPLPLQPTSPSLIATSRIPELSNLQDSSLSSSNQNQYQYQHQHSLNSPPSSASNSNSHSRPSASTSKRKTSSHQASFVTASALLSRSGAVYPIPDLSNGRKGMGIWNGDWNRGWGSAGRFDQESQQHDREDDSNKANYRRGDGSGHASRKGKGKGNTRTSNGSALEAFSALLLHRETRGKASNLSFTKHGEFEAEDISRETSIPSRSDLNNKKQRPDHLKLANRNFSSYSVGNLTDWVSPDWLEKVRLEGAIRLGLMLPDHDFKRWRSEAQLDKGSEERNLTIAERRARKLGLETPLSGGSGKGNPSLDQTFRFCRIGTRYGEPVFQLENPPKKPDKSKQRERVRDGNILKVKGRVLIDGVGIKESFAEDEKKEEREKEASENDQEVRAPNGVRPIGRDINMTLPPNTRLLLKRSRESSPNLSNPSSSSSNPYGIGSSRFQLELPDAPPSPLGMPGEWSTSNLYFNSNPNSRSYQSSMENNEFSGALLLPPPLLDNKSSPNSFEGLLGIRRQREMEKKRKELEKLRKRNRPDHKAGPLTALLNFVKAAHAAERSVKKNSKSGKISERPVLGVRSFTEPAFREQESEREESNLESESRTPINSTFNADAFKQPSHSQLGGISSSPMVRRTSGSTSHSVEIEEFELDQPLPHRSSSSSSSSSSEEEELEALESLDTITEDLSSSFTSLGEAPRAPRLLPVQLSVPPSPSTPLTSTVSSRRESLSDYISARSNPEGPFSLAPRTPRLGPTLMSLPPSPWTPYHSSQSPPSHQYQFHLNTTSVNGPPGTPTLVPTHLEILPSPFPTPNSSNRNSFSLGGGGSGSSAPAALKMTSVSNGFPIESRRSASTSSSSSSSPSMVHHSNFLERDANSSAPVILSPTQLAADSPSQSSLPSTPTNVSSSKMASIGRKTVNGWQKEFMNGGMSSPGRLTPSSMLSSLPQEKPSSTSIPPSSSPPKAPKLGPRPSEPQVLSPILSSTHRRMSINRSQRRSSSIGSAHSHATPLPNLPASKQRSFLIWFLIGDLWLDTRSTLSIESAKSSYLGGIAGVAFHFLNFVIFILAHLIALVQETSESLSLAFWFLRWIVLNLAGRTVLSRCLIEAHQLISTEWETVSKEDHENRGNKKRKKKFGEDGIEEEVGEDTVPRGLSKWQVLRGLAELAALQNVTRKRYLEEGAGLIKLEGWKKQKRNRKNNKFNGRESSFELEKTKLRAVDELEMPDRSGTSDSFDSQQNEEDEESSSEDEDEGDIVVTNQGQDILELAKTPRILPTHLGGRPSISGRNPSSYFSESVPLDQKKKERRGRENPTFSEDPRMLVKTIKWASRLAISAYGLHVHIVDLPPTFTPSGERFSRQTFAHLSRLDGEDVLHADIQTLDSEAAYTPTFYVVRDYARKVVVVAVRGTQSFSDIIIDLEMQTERVDLRDIEGISSDSVEPMLCHAGILRAARALIARDSTLMDTLQAALEENEDFGVCLIGHSLGGSVAAVAALLLSEYNTEGIKDGNSSKGSWVTSSSSGLPSKRPIRAITFAPPATVSSALASRASLGVVPLVTTAVLGSDVIPRAGHGQARELRRVLGALSRVRRRNEALFGSDSTSKSKPNSSTHNEEDDARVHIIKSWWDWRSICTSVKPDAVMLHKKDRIEEQLWKLRCDVEADLYAAVKSRHDDNNPISAHPSNPSSTSTSPATSTLLSVSNSSNSRSRIPPSPWVGPQQRAKAPLHQLATRRQAIDAATLRSESAQGVLPILFPAGRSIWISGGEIYVITSPLAFFSLPDLHPSMFAEHFPSAYESAFEDLPL